MPMSKALAALWTTPRVYYQQNELIEPRQGHVYGVLGNGLDPNHITYRNVETTPLSDLEHKRVTMKKATGAGEK
jgi:hypothetical protein